MYVIETKNGYISELTLIFDKECEFMKEAFFFNEKQLKRFFLFRDKKRYRVYKIGRN